MGRMHLLAMAILGAWLGVTLFMGYVAVNSFTTVNRVMRSSSPPVTESTKKLGESQTRLLLRYLAAEINRAGFSVYGWSQIVIGCILLFLVIRQTPRNTVDVALAALMLVAVLVLTIVIAPKIAALGRQIDFVPRNPPPPEMGRFRMLHASFTGLDAAKLVAGLVLIIRWIVRA